MSVTATVALFAGGVSVANAAPGDLSAASGTFLSGTLLGLDAGLVALIGGETAASTGSADQTESNTLDVTALSVVNIDIGGGVQVPLRVADLGVVGQYASALQDGSSVGASGLISSAGAIGTGITPAPGVAPGPLSLNLSQAIGSLGLPPATLSQVADLDLTVGVTSANASQAAPAAAVGDYEIAGATLDLSSPTLSGVIGAVQTGVGTLQTTVDGLDNALNSALSILNVLGLVDVGVDVDTTSLWAGVSGLLTGDITDPAYPGVTVNLEDGTVSVDLDQLHPLNGQPVDTDILSPAVLAEIEASVLGLVDDVLAEVTTTLTTAVRGLHVGGGATILGADILTLDTSVGAILDGDTSGIALLGLGLGLPGGLSAIVDALATPLESLITSITDLAAAALAPVNDDLLPALSPIISGVVSLHVNNQQTTAGVFSETALRVTVLPLLNPLTLEIANATVGPNSVAAAAPTLTGITPVSGPVAGGTIVTLTGTGFTGATAVSFGSDAATAFTVNSDTSITATSPGHAAGPVDVTVTTAGGPSGPQTFTYVAAPAAPTLTGITPVSGPVAGGTIVTLTGTGFTGATAVSFGTDAATAFTVNSDTSITATSPAHAAGPVDVTVTTAGGPSGPQTFTYVAAPAAPTLTGITPVSGPVAGGTIVTLTGTGFTGATAVTFGTDAATAFTVNSDTSITATSPAHAAGPVDVTVTTAGGPSGPQTFTYVAAPAAPTLTGITPVSGPVAGGTIVTLTGTGFTGATAVSFGTDAATSFTVNSDTSITATSPAHAVGPVDVTVTTAGGPSGPQTFTYVAAPAAPTVLSLSPTHGPSTGGTVVTILGSGFSPSDAVLIGGATVVPTMITPGTITFVAPAHVPGAVTVVVQGPGGDSGALRYDYDPVTTIGTIDPGEGPEAGGTTVTITGSCFTGATGVLFDLTPATSFTVVSDTEISAVVPPGSPGTASVTVIGAPLCGNGTDPDGYEYLAAPDAAGILPAAGSELGGTIVEITGTGFTGATAVSFDGIAATQFTVNSDSSITATTPAHVPGTVDAVVTGPGGASAPLDFTFTAEPVVPGTEIDTVDPGTGPELGGNTVTITGSCFTGATAVLFGGTPATSFTVVNDTTITAVVPAGTAGVVDVTVIGSATCGTATDPGGYEYVAPPSVTAISPDKGPETGGTVVTLTGEGFTGATSVTIDGDEVIFTVVDDSTITFTTPAHGPGEVDVVVSGPGGASDPVTFTFTAVPTPGATATPAAIAKTGFDSIGGLLAALALVLSGAVLFLVRRRATA